MCNTAKRFAEWAEEGFNIDGIIFNEMIYSIRQEWSIPNCNQEYVVHMLVQAFNEKPSEKIYNLLVEYYSKNKIVGDKFLVVADTHIGGIETDFKMIDSAFDTGSKLGVDAIIHLGDFIEGYCNRDNAKPLTLNEQINLFEKYYPNVNIPQYGITGNHDAIYYYPEPHRDFKDVLESKGINIFGEFRDYGIFNEKSHIVKLFHCEKDNKCIPDDLNYDIQLSGHSHEYNFNEDKREIVVPALSKRSNYSGFIILRMTNEEYISALYNFDNNYKSYIKEEKVLKYKK